MITQPTPTVDSLKQVLIRYVQIEGPFNVVLDSDMANLLSDSDFAALIAVWDAAVLAKYGSATRNVIFVYESSNVASTQIV